MTAPGAAGMLGGAKRQPSCLRNTWVLTRKNFLLKRADLFGSLLEVLLPLAFVVAMLGLKSLFHTEVVAAVSYESGPNLQSIPPFFSLPVGLQLAGSGARIAVTSLSPTGSGADAAARFHADAAARYPTTNLSALGGGAFARASSGSALLQGLVLPGYADVAVTFASEAALQTYVEAEDYGSAAKPPIFAAVVFSSGLPQLDYTLRFNSSVLPNVFPFVFTYSPSFRGGTKYLTFDAPAPKQYGAASATSQLAPGLPAPPSPPSVPAFLPLQLMVDRFAINSSAGAPEAVLDPQALVATFCAQLMGLAGSARSVALAEALDTACQGLLLDAAGAAAVGADLARGALAAEALVPQHIDLLPFPTRQYTQNVFFSGVLNALTLLFVLAYIYPVSRLISALVYEKESKMREMMLIMGLTDSALYASWFASYAATFLVLCLGITVLGVGLFPSSSPGIVFLLFFTFSTSTVSMCMLISVFFSQSKVGSVLGSAVFLGGYFVFFSIKTTTPLQLRLLAALLSPTALGMGLQTLAQLETNGVGATATTASTLSVNDWTVGATISMQLWDTVLYLLLAYYCEKVLPSWARDFGTPLPFYFPCLPSFWGCRCSLRRSGSGAASGEATSDTPLLDGKGAASASASASAAAPAAPAHFERPDALLAAKEREGRCVSLRGLRKEFDTPDGVKVAVAGVDMTLYEGEIFVLLGHNGAGKTTTISMLTGLIPPSAGSARVFGAELGSDLGAIRSDLGVCPQHDVLWPTLTVQEHLEIFAAFKGVPAAGVAGAAAEALAQVGLTEKAGAAAGGLSGGMKRKLSVCLAFLGGSRVVLLDEPTSGMDPYSRRSTWQILQSAREGRVILLTTHFMDEADILGDRVSVMSGGRVECCGSPAFLKDAYGLGYTLTVVLGGGGVGGEGAGGARATTAAAALPTLLPLVRAHVPGAVVVSQAGAEVKFRLPVAAGSVAAATAAYPALLRELEALKGTVNSLGMHLTSIEDIFMKIATEGHAGHAGEGEGEGEGSDAGAGAGAAAGKAPESRAAWAAPADSAAATLQAVRAAARAELSPWDAFYIHVGAIFLKRARYARRDWKAVCCLLLVPVLALTGGLSLLLSGSFFTTLDFQLSTAQFNSASFFAAQGTGPTLVPAFTYIPAAAPGTAAPAPLPATAQGVTDFLAQFQAANVSFDGGRLLLGGSAALALDASNRWGFITNATLPAPPLHDLQRMATFLLDDSPAYRDSKFGALVVTGGERSALLPSAAPRNLTLAILYNSTAVNGAPIFLNLATTAALRGALGVAPGAPETPATPRITTHVHALPYTAWELGNLLIGQSFGVIQVLLLSLSFVTPSFVQFIVREREVSAKHQQLISGVSIPAYWVANLAWDALTYLVPASLCLICLRAFNASYFITPAAGKLAAVVLLLALYGLSGASFTYAASHLFAAPGSAAAAAVMFNILQFAATVALNVLGLFATTCRAVEPAQAALNLLPYFALGTGLSRVAALDTLGGPTGSGGGGICDKLNGVFKPDSSYPPPVTSALALGGAGGPLLYLAVTFPLYLLAAIAIDYARADMAFRSRVEAALAWGWARLRCSGAGGASGGAAQLQGQYAATPSAEVDADVAAEAARAEGALAAADGSEAAEAGSGAASAAGDVILLSQLTKSYGSKAAVRGLSFGVPSGEVFGFLGINGAGKTTTLRMLTGDELPGGGRATLAGYDIISQQGAVRRLLGYCPQFDALLDLLTVREHLELYARIKGVALAALGGVVADKLREFDLREFENKLAGRLSGGNKRKLSVAIALIGGPPVVFLDEPSTGVDPVAKRFMWRVIARVASPRPGLPRTSIILTTHSMEEVEALCGRIGIMVGGRLRCLGSAQHLRDVHGAGFTLDVRLPGVGRGAVAALEARAAGALAGGGGGGAGAQVTRAALPALAAALGRAAWAEEVRDEGRGWALAGALARSGSVSVGELAAWWAGMEAAEAAEARVCSSAAFPGAALTERQGATLKFRVPASAGGAGEGGAPAPLSALFSRVEQLRSALGEGACVTLGQTSLEAVFNAFAAQQEEEVGVARGLVRP